MRNKLKIKQQMFRVLCYYSMRFQREKLFSLVAICLLFNFPSFAEQGEIGIALKAGINHSNMIVRDKTTNTKLQTNPRDLPFFYFEFEYRFSRILSYIAGFSYLRHGYSVHVTNHEYPHTYRRDLLYLGFPQKLRITVSLLWIEIFGSLGVSGEALLTAKYHREYDNNAKQGYTLDIKEGYNTGILTPEMDFGIGILFQNLRLSLETTFVIGGDDITKPYVYPPHTHTRKINDVRYYLGLAYYFK